MDLDLDTLFQIACIDHSSYEENSKAIIEQISSNNKEVVFRIIKLINNVLEDRNEETISKFLALLLLKDCMDIKNQTIIDVVSQKTIDILADLAKKDKKNLFPNGGDSKTIANFQQLLLECIVEWAIEYGIAKKTNTMTKYRQTYTGLVNQNVKFPDNRVYFNSKKSEKDTKNANPSSKDSNKGNNQKNTPIPPSNSNSAKLEGTNVEEDKQNTRILEKIKKFVSLSDMFIENMLYLEERDDEVIYTIHKQCKQTNDQLQKLIDSFMENSEEDILNTLFNLVDVISKISKTAAKYLKVKSDTAFIEMKNTTKTILKQINDIKIMLDQTFGIKIKLLVNKSFEKEQTLNQQQQLPSEIEVKRKENEVIFNESKIAEEKKENIKNDFDKNKVSNDNTNNVGNLANFDNFNFNFADKSQPKTSNTLPKKESNPKEFTSFDNFYFSKPENETPIQKLEPEIPPKIETASNIKNSNKQNNGYKNAQPINKLREVPVIAPKLNLGPEVKAQISVENRSEGSPFQEHKSFISEELTEFIPIELNHLLNNIKQKEDNKKSPEEIQAERDALIKLIENIKRNQVVLNLEHEFLKKNYEDKYNNMNNLKQESIKQQTRYNNAMNIQKQLQAEHQSLQAKKFDLQSFNERITRDYLASEKQLKLAEAHMTEDELQENKIKLKNKTSELEFTLNNYNDQYQILQNALEKIRYESHEIDNQLTQIKSTPPRINYYNKVFDSPSVKLSNFFIQASPPKSHINEETQVLKINGTDINSSKLNDKHSKSDVNNSFRKDKLVSNTVDNNLKNTYELLEKSRNLRTEISSGLINNQTLSKDNKPSPTKSNLLEEFVLGQSFKPVKLPINDLNGNGTNVSKTSSSQLKNKSQYIIYDEPFFKQLTQTIEECSFISHLDVFKIACLQSESMLIDTEFFTVEQSCILNQATKELKISFLYQNKSGLDITNFSINLATINNLKIIPGIRNGNIKSDQSLAQDFIQKFGDHKISSPLINLALNHGNNHYETKFLLPFTINKYITPKNLNQTEFSDMYQRLKDNQLTIDGRPLNKSLFASIDDILLAFDNMKVNKTNLGANKTKLGCSFLLPDDKLYLLEMSIYDNISKFDITITADSINQEIAIKLLQTFAFLMSQ